MSKKASPTLIGAFAVGALVLLAAGVVLFGGTHFFSERELYVAYFNEDTNGLRVGSNVVTNGVRVGQVTEIALLVDVASYETTTRVTLEILPNTLIQTRNGEVVGQGMDFGLSHEALIDKAGLRANLDVESFITGQLLVELALRPDTAAEYHAANPPHPEIPTVQSNIRALLDKVQEWIAAARENVDIAEWSRRVDNILSGLDALSNSDDLRRSLAAIRALVDSDDTRGLAAAVASAMQGMGDAAADASKLFRNLDTSTDTLTDELAPAIEQLNTTLEEAERTLAAARGQLQGSSAQVVQLQETLQEIERATRAIREFFDYLERNPEALLKGRKQ